MNATEPADIEGTKRKNIIKMALGFSAMLRIFVEGSKGRIAAKVGEFFIGLGEIRDHDDYEDRHRSFCEWFTRNIRTTGKTLKTTRVKRGGQSSYGQAAKVLDVAIKVYVYYCAQPTPEIAQRIVPLLHGAIDTAVLKHLKTSKCARDKIRATTIKDLRVEGYQTLQRLLLAESLARNLHAVEYDDVLYHRLNRG